MFVDSTATRSNTLHHTATHCNTLQHTATHLNTLLRRWVPSQCAWRIHIWLIDMSSYLLGFPYSVLVQQGRNSRYMCVAGCCNAWLIHMSSYIRGFPYSVLVQQGRNSRYMCVAGCCNAWLIHISSYVREFPYSVLVQQGRKPQVDSTESLEEVPFHIYGWKLWGGYD